MKPFKNFPCESEDGDANIFQNTSRSKDFQDWTLGTTRNSTNHFKFLELIHSLATFWHEIVKRNIIQWTWKTGHQIGNPNFFWHFLTYICYYFEILGPKCFASENMNRDILARTLVAEVSISRIPFLVRNASSLLSGFGSKKASQTFLPGNIAIICPNNV